MSSKKAKPFIGIDVSKNTLEVAAHEPEKYFRCRNQTSAFPELIAELITLRPALIVLEATGGWEIPVTQALHQAGLPVVVVNPRQVRNFAKAVGQLAKTDRLDARVLAHFAAAVKPPVRPIKSEQAQQLDALLDRRRQLVEMLAAEKNRRRAAAISPTVQEEIEEHIDWLEDRIQALDQQLKRQIKQSASGNANTRYSSVCPASVPWWRWPVSQNCLSWASSTDSRSASWWESPRSTATAVTAAALDTSMVAELTFAT